MTDDKPASIVKDQVMTLKPTRDDMISYAKAAMEHGWQTACEALKEGSLNCAWDSNWFEQNPPECAILPDEARTLPLDGDVVEQVREIVWLAQRAAYTDGNQGIGIQADAKLLAEQILTATRSGDGELRCNQCGKKGGGHHPSCILGPALSSIRDR